jgi:hypothetical protein
MKYLYGVQHAKRRSQKTVRKNLTGGLACRLWNGVTGRCLVPEGREIISFIQAAPCVWTIDGTSLLFQVGEFVE